MSKAPTALRFFLPVVLIGIAWGQEIVDQFFLMAIGIY